LLLAHVHRAAGEFFSAEDNIVAAIEILGSDEEADPMSLIGPYSELGETYFEVGEYRLAIAAFDEARMLGHRESGQDNTFTWRFRYEVRRDGRARRGGLVDRMAPEVGLYRSPHWTSRPARRYLASR
jgi:tetratricopeptide (TPR) repeat protein